MVLLQSESGDRTVSAIRASRTLPGLIIYFKGVTNVYVPIIAELLYILHSKTIQFSF